MSADFGVKAVSDPRHHCFISYSRSDIDQLAPIVQLLSKKMPVWYDIALPTGANFEAYLVEQIRQCRIMVFFASRALFERQDTSYMYYEYGYAHTTNRPCLCVWMDDIKLFDTSHLNAHNDKILANAE